jgi:hypothetical protein
MFSTPHVALALALVLTAGACSSSGDGVGPTATAIEQGDRERGELPRGESREFGPSPNVPAGDLAPGVADALVVLSRASLDAIVFDDKVDAIETLGSSSDARVGWVLSDLLRLARDPGDAARLAGASSEVLGPEFSPFNAWGDVTDHLIAWDVPEPPGYLDLKRAIFTRIVPEWEPFFEEGADIDWRYIAWGGVRIDDRPFDTTVDPCNCIPAADNPDVQPAGEATWLDDDDVVFGVVINGESRAYPRQIMEVREMVNDTLGGREFGMPYCTLCGSAQVWFTDDLPEGVDRPVLRTSGLLTRSNKVMFDLNTFSIFDTFLGTAQSGPLAEQGISLDQHSVVTSTWVDWREAHPETTVLIEELSLDRDFDFRNNRDANGPIFPIGDVDPRLPVQEDVLGVTTADSVPLAFHVASARAALDQGESIEVDGITLIVDGGGVRAVDANGDDAGGHQAFWFAWSQFHPDTRLWPN